MFGVEQIPEAEIEMTAVRSAGPGGQNVNKVSSAIHLRFDISKSSLPDELKSRLLALRDRRISSDGIVVIKAQRSRSQEANREDALRRLDELLRKAQIVKKSRRRTRPTRGSVERRLNRKSQRAKIKSLRRRPSF